MKQLLLISNSTIYGRGYLDHAGEAIRRRLGERASVLFVPYALFDRDSYADKAAARFQSIGYATTSIHRAADAVQAVENAQAIFIGGGNTFRLLKALYDNRVLEPIRRRVGAGIPYIGSSAGSNVAGKTIKTTKDMPIVYPPSLDALALIPFQISPHFQDPDPSSKHMGETQEERIVQFLEENETPVCGLREGSMLWVDDDAVTLMGGPGARLFRRNADPYEARDGERIDQHLT